MAEAASILLNTPTIRLYQDSLFVKRVGDGWTPWHVDARMAPFDTPNMITFWVPLQSVPTPKKGGTGLRFVDGSHSDFALPYWNRPTCSKVIYSIDSSRSGDLIDVVIWEQVGRRLFYFVSRVPHFSLTTPV